MPEAHEESTGNHEVRIHIDEVPYESPNPTTGASLYRLAKTRQGFDLFREVTGDREDPVIPNSPEMLRLKEDEHFHSGPPKVTDFDIFVNGRKKVVATRDLSFKQLVGLAFNPVPSGPNIIFTITYRHGPPANPEGNLLEGGTVQLKDGMVFNVTATDKS